MKLAVLAAAGVLALGLQQTPQRPTFRAGTRTVMVPASVTDARGENVSYLTRDDFEVRDNGVPQPLTYFDRATEPITAALLLDGSASMLSALSSTISAADEFVLRLMPGDRLRLGSFAEELRWLGGFTGDRDALLDLLKNEFNIRIGRRTILWDAMFDALEVLRTETGRRVLIVITDGVDTRSIRTYDEVRREAGRRDVVICFARVFGPDNGGQMFELSRGPDGTGPGERRPIPRDAFEILAQQTGGELVALERQYGMTAPFTEIVRDLHSQYVLGFTPATLDGKEHKIEVRVTKRGFSVRARKTYLAAEDAAK